MGMTLADIRAKYPEAYKDKSDQQLADAIYAKFYSTVDRREFDARIGLKPYQNTLESSGTAIQNAPTRLQMGVTGLQQMTAEGQSDNFTALQSAPPEELAVDANFQNYAAENGLNDLTAAAADPAIREAFFQSAGMDAAKRAVGAALTYQQQQESLKPIDVSAGSLDYYLSGAIGSTAEMIPALVASVITKNPTPGVAMIMGQVSGQNYAQGRADGLDPGRAREYAALMSAAEAIPSYLPLGQFLSHGGNGLVNLGKGALSEAFQEGLTQALQIGINMGYLSPDMTMGEALNQIKDAAIIGAIAGTMMEGGVKGAEVAGNKLYDGIYTATTAGKAAIQSILPKTQQVSAPVKEGPTMLDRVNQALQRKGFAPIVPLPPAETVAPGSQPAGETSPTPEAGATPAATDQPATVPPLVTGAPSAADQIITIESGGNPTAQNPNGSAGGLGGFIDSTWIATVRKAAPELAGESDAQILARKKDATPEGIAFQRRMVQAHIDENIASLQANGIEATPGNLYAAHFLGAGGANTVLKADDGAALAPLVGEAVMEANPFLKGMTVGDFKAWTSQKMGGAGVSTITAGGAAAPAVTAAATSAENAQVAAPTLDPAAGQEFDTTAAEPAVAAPVTIEPIPAQAEAQPATIVEPSPTGTAITSHSNPAPVTTPADLAAAGRDVNPDPTPAQIEAGNYRKAHVELNGFNISIENPRGSIRRGTDTDGEAWEVTMPADYGYIKRTTGADGEQVDVYIGQSPSSKRVYVIDQIDPKTGAFDEHKVVMGANSQAEARLIYDSAFSDSSGASRRAAITTFSPDTFREWLKTGDPRKPVKAPAKVKAKELAKPKEGKEPAPDAELANDPRFEPDRKAAKQFKPGQRVEWTNENFNPPRVFTGTIKAKQFAGFKNMGVLEVDADGGRDGGTHEISIGAAQLRPEGQKPTPPTLEEETITVTAPGGMKVEVRPEVVGLDTLKAATGELQPRDRSRAASDAQIEEMAANLDPDRLLPSKEADRGAPIVGPDGVVESGNGRASAIRRAREAYPAKYAAYVEAMRAAGYTIEDGQLVVSRRVSEFTDAERVDFVTSANTSAIARMSATEQAIIDAKAIDAGVMATLQVGISPLAPTSKFAQAFLAKLPQAERAALTDRDGTLNSDGVRRIQNALLAAAYSDASTVAKAAENVDDNAKAITGAMTDVSPEWLAMRRAIEASDVGADYDMTDSLMSALKIIDRARSTAAKQGTKVKDELTLALGQIDMLSGAVDPVAQEIVRAFYSEGFGRAKSRDDIGMFLRSITTEVESAIQPQLLGAAPRPEEIINGARRRSEKAESGDLFASRAPRGLPAARRDGNGERGVQGAEPQDQQRVGQEAIAGSAAGRVDAVSGSVEQAAGQRAEPGAEDRSGTAADRGQEDAELSALGVDKPMPGYVPMYARTGVPDRPANDRIRVGNREIELPPLDRPQRREGIRVQLEQIVGKRLYVGKIKGASMLGFYRKRNSEIRTKAYDDVEVMAHEMAHYLDFHYTHAGRFTASYKGRKDVAALSYTSSPQNVQKEGFAEFVRLWLTQYDAAVQAAPAYVKDFEALLAKDKQLDAQMHKLQEQMHKWFLQGPHAQLRAKSGEEFTPTERWMQFVQSYPLERARQNTIDRIHAMKVVERVTQGDVLDATKSAYKQMQVANGAESTYEAIVRYGTPVLDVDGSLQFGGEPLMKVFWPVAKHGWKRFDLLMDYFKARRGAELIRQKRENLFTVQEIRAGLKLGQQYPEFAAVFGAFQKFNQRMLDWYVDMGLITEEAREAFGEANKNYVPFQRVIKSIETGETRGAGGIGQRLSGSTANTRDIAVNIVEGLATNVRNAMVARAKATMYKQIMASQDGALFAAKIGPDSKKVKALLSDQARKVAEVMMDLGIGISSNGIMVNQPNVAGATYDVNDIADALEKRPELMEFWLVNQPPKTDGDTYVDSAIVDGERMYFEVREPLLVDMLTGMKSPQIGAVLRGLFFVKNVMTRGVTAWPEFVFINLVRDTLSSMVLSKNNFVPIATSLRGMVDTFKQNDTYKEFMLNGAGYGNSIEARTAETRSRRQLDIPAHDNWDRVAKVLAGWDRFASSFEYGSRVGDYRLSRAAGRNPMEAAWQAREIATDFSKIGRSDLWANFLRTVPFMNAAIQGNDKTIREIAESKGKMTLGNVARMNQQKAKFLLRGGVLVAATVLLWLLNKDDERYKALPDDERARYWWIFAPGLDRPIKIARPFDIGHIFASIPETMLNFAYDKDGAAAAKQLGWIMTNTFPSAEWPGFMTPIMEAASNKDWRGAAVIPEHIGKREPRYQYDERTPLVYRWLGQNLNVSPMLAQHYAEGYLSYGAQMMSNSVDALFWNEKEWGPRPFAQTPVVDTTINRFLGREVPFRTKWTDGYYDLKRRAEGVQSSFTALKAEAMRDGAPLTGFLSSKTNTTLIGINKMFGQMDRAFSEGDAILASITYNPDLSRAEKEHQINEFYAQKNRALGELYQQVEEMLRTIDAD